mmetsp:Transcript_48946/g.119878  ORF Transcript_48946/g.119878 Transcript_48946/m.119878 type:complete len:308 (+) Transcript_48946:113-1036(+)
MPKMISGTPCATYTDDARAHAKWERQPRFDAARRRQRRLLSSDQTEFRGEQAGTRRERMDYWAVRRGRSVATKSCVLHRRRQRSRLPRRARRRRYGTRTTVSVQPRGGRVARRVRRVQQALLLARRRGHQHHGGARSMGPAPVRVSSLAVRRGARRRAVLPEAHRFAVPDAALGVARTADDGGADRRWREVALRDATQFLHLPVQARTHRRAARAHRAPHRSRRRRAAGATGAGARRATGDRQRDPLTGVARDRERRADPARRRRRSTTVEGATAAAPARRVACAAVQWRAPAAPPSTRSRSTACAR